MGHNEFLAPELIAERRPDDIDFIEAVHEKLLPANWSGLATWRDEPEILEARDKTPALQRFLITRNLNAKFCGRGSDTRVPRMVLNAQSPDEEYLEHLSQYVGPGLAKLDASSAH